MSKEPEDVKITPSPEPETPAAPAEPTAASPAEPATEAPTEPAEAPEAGAKHDGEKFVAFTKRLTASAEKVIGESYKKAKTAGSRFEPRASIGWLERLLAWARQTFPADRFESLASKCVKYGHYGLVAAQALTVLFGFTAAVKHSNWVYFLYGIGVAALLVILQYTANRFLNAGDALIKASPSRLGSKAFPDCLALLAEVAGILAFLSYLLAAHRMGQWSLVWVGLGVLALFDSVAYIALHPSMTNTSIDESVRAGEEAIGIMSFLVKALVRIVPLAYGIGTVLGAIGLLFGTFSLIGSGLPQAGRAALRLIVLCTCLPLASYVFFAFYHLAIDILRAILVLPSKIDSLADKKNWTSHRADRV